LSSCPRTIAARLRTLVPFLSTIVLVFENTPLAVLTVGRSSVRQRILALLLDESSGRLHLREIQRRARTSPGTASRELAKLVAAGLIDREAEGNQVYFRASVSPFATMLRSLLVAMPAPEFGPAPPRLPGAGRRPSVKAPSAGVAPVDPSLIAPTRPEAVPAPSAEAAAEAAPVGLTPSQSEGVHTPIDREARLGHDQSATSLGPRVIRPLPVAPDRPEQLSATPAASTVTSGTRTDIPAAPDALGLRVAGRLAESVRSIYGGTLRGVYLYGARASGPAPTEADVETIIVLDRVDHYGAELERTSHVCAALSHELNLVVSRIFVAEADWNGGPDGTPPRIRTEAVAV
jgi:DNA-binding transcriptional ArsR family regulator